MAQVQPISGHDPEKPWSLVAFITNILNEVEDYDRRALVGAVIEAIPARRKEDALWQAVDSLVLNYLAKKGRQHRSAEGGNDPDDGHQPAPRLAPLPSDSPRWVSHNAVYLKFLRSPLTAFNNTKRLGDCTVEEIDEAIRVRKAQAAGMIREAAKLHKTAAEVKARGLTYPRELPEAVIIELAHWTPDQ